MADTFLTFQKSNQENASAIEPANKKLDKKAVFFPYSGDEPAICCDRAFQERRDQPFLWYSLNFLLWGTRAERLEKRAVPYLH